MLGTQANNSAAGKMERKEEKKGSERSTNESSIVVPLVAQRDGRVGVEGGVDGICM